jgi:nucleoside-diphosphate-sugar epimerase
MSKVVVTGGSGKAGRACIKDLLAHGHEVLNVDKAVPTDKLCPFLLADLSDFGQTIDACADGPGGNGVDGVVHLAAIPGARVSSNAVTFANNMLSTYNIFEAARRSELERLEDGEGLLRVKLPFRRLRRKLGSKLLRNALRPALGVCVHMDTVPSA